MSWIMVSLYVVTFWWLFILYKFIVIKKYLITLIIFFFCIFNKIRIQEFNTNTYSVQETIHTEAEHLYINTHQSKVNYTYTITFHTHPPVFKIHKPSLSRCKTLDSRERVTQIKKASIFPTSLSSLRYDPSFFN